MIERIKMASGGDDYPASVECPLCLGDAGLLDVMEGSGVYICSACTTMVSICAEVDDAYAYVQWIEYGDLTAESSLSV